ncbi:MAG: hypothetical protein IT435_15910 [Phycisphaerales bacterium]|nr:hypothetical protein [Phycisphaerales bacterium]
MQPTEIPSTRPSAPLRIQPLNARLLGGFLRALRCDRGLEPADVARLWFPGEAGIESIEQGRIADAAHLAVGVGVMLHVLGEVLPVANSDVEHCAALLGVRPVCLVGKPETPFRTVEVIEPWRAAA